MDVIRDINTISGFRLMHPWEGWDWLTHCGEQTCSRRHYVPPHRHAAFEFFYMQRGQAAWTAGGATFLQEPGVLFIAHPEEWHSSVYHWHEGYHTQFLGLQPEALGDTGAELAEQLRAGGIHLLAHCEDVEPVLRGLIRQALARGPGCREVAGGYLVTFVALLRQRLAAQQGGNQAPAGPPYAYPLEKAVRFMTANLDRRLPLAEVAGVAGYALSQFCRRFREEVGVSPAAYHLELRLQAARDALRQPGSTVTLVAHAYGFSSAQHFTTAFRRLFGLTPCAWQKQAAAMLPKNQARE